MTAKTNGTEIHPTAVVDQGVELGSDVYIGPYCVLRAGVKIGDGTKLQNHVTICGPTTIGQHNEFYSFTSIGQQSQDLKYEEEPTFLEIGDHNVFREFVTVNRATSPHDKTLVGSHNHFLTYSHIAHDCIVGDHVIFSNNGTIAGHVVVEDYAIIGGLSAVHQFCKIGKHSITGGCTKVVQDIPPFMIADGNPAEIRGINQIGLQRQGFSKEVIAAAKSAFKVLYREDLNTTQAVEKLKISADAKIPELAHLIQFVESSERGIVR